MLLKKDSIDEVKLIYGVNKEDELIYTEEFEKLEKKHEKFEFIKVAALMITGKVKRVCNKPMERLNLDDYKIYMCGPKPMINASLDKLNKLGIEEDRIYFESA